MAKRFHFTLLQLSLIFVILSCSSRRVNNRIYVDHMPSANVDEKKIQCWTYEYQVYNSKNEEIKLSEIGLFIEEDTINFDEYLLQFELSDSCKKSLENTGYTYAFSFQRNDESKFEIKEILRKDHKHEIMASEIERYVSQASFTSETPAFDQEYLLVFRIKIEN